MLFPCLKFFLHLNPGLPRFNLWTSTKWCLWKAFPDTLETLTPTPPSSRLRGATLQRPSPSSGPRARGEGDLPQGQHTPRSARAGSHVVRWERAAPPRHAPRACASYTPLGRAPPPCPRTLFQTREGQSRPSGTRLAAMWVWDLRMGHPRIFEPRLRTVKSGKFALLRTLGW